MNSSGTIGISKGDACRPYLQKDVSSLEIIATEALAAVKHVLPSMLSWIWRKYIFNDIKTIPLSVTMEKATKVAYLNIHGDFDRSEVAPILFSHGDYSHPCSMLHLIDIAQKAGRPTFSLYIPGVNDNLQNTLHDFLLKQAIDKIESLVLKKDGKFTGVVGVGHSKGAILLAQRSFVALDSRIKAVCSIAGRLNILSESDSPDKDLKAIVKTIYEGIQAQPKNFLFQIIPKEDWNAPYAAMAVRPEKYCHTVPGMHLSGLYSQETKEHILDFLTFFQ